MLDVKCSMILGSVVLSVAYRREKFDIELLVRLAFMLLLLLVVLP